jgi:hypothetical protein
MKHPFISPDCSSRKLFEGAKLAWSYLAVFKPFICHYAPYTAERGKNCTQAFSF